RGRRRVPPDDGRRPQRRAPRGLGRLRGDRRRSPSRRGRGPGLDARHQRRAPAARHPPQRHRRPRPAPGLPRRPARSRLRPLRLPEPPHPRTGRGPRDVTPTDAADVVRSYHEATTHGGDHDRSRLIAFRPLDPANRPAPFKLYPDYPFEPIPEGDELGRVLFHSLGVTRTSGTSYFRAAMSAGNLHPLEAYVVGGDLSVRHYHPLRHALTTPRPRARG